MSISRQIFVRAANPVVSRLKMNPDLIFRVEEAIQKNRTLGTHIFSFGGFQFIINEGVFSPSVFDEAALFAARLGQPDIKSENKDMLDVGCGSGFIGLWLLKKRGLKSVILSDITKAAVECANLNIRNLKCAETATVIQSDVFDSVPSSCKFDIINWNHPWEVQAADYVYPDGLARSAFDRGYEGLEKYMRGLSHYLRPKGRAFLGFGESGDEDALKNIADDCGIEPVVIEKFAAERNFGIPFSLYELCR